MKKLQFFAGIAVGVIVCLAVCLVGGYYLLEKYASQQQQPQQAAAQSAPQNLAQLASSAQASAPQTPKDALDALNKIILLRPQDPQAYLQKADLLAQLGDYKNALETYNQAVSLNPSDARAYLNRSVAKFMLQDYSGAKDDLNAAIALNPEFGKAFYNRGVANVNLMKLNSALADFAKASELFAKKGDKTSYADAAKAYNTVNNYVKTSSSPSAKAAPQAQRRQAVSQLKAEMNASSGKYKSELLADLSGAGAKNALEKFRAAQAARGGADFADAGIENSINAAANDLRTKQTSMPKTVLDYRAEAQKKLATGDFAGAKTALDKAIELSPKDSNLYAQRAAASAQMQDYKSAIEDYGRAISADPKNAAAYYQRAAQESLLGNNKAALKDLAAAENLYDKQGNKQGAEQSRNMANTISGKNVSVQRTDTDAQRLLKEGTNLYNGGNYQDALQKFNELVQRQPNVPEIYYNRAITNAALGKTDEAMKDYNNAIKRNPNMPDAYLGAANILLQQQKTSQAKDYLDKAIALNPNNPKAYTMSGMVDINNKNNDKAMEDFNKAISLDKEDGAARLYRGVLYAQQNNAEKALQDIEQAKKLAAAQHNEKLLQEARKYEDMINQARQQGAQ